MDSLLDLYHMQGYARNLNLKRARFAVGYLFSSLLRIGEWRPRLLYQMHDLTSKVLGFRAHQLSLIVKGFEFRGRCYLSQNSWHQVLMIMNESLA
jgi:hypothetical protein